MPSLSSEIIVGIDFGTTHSGVSWAINEGKKNIRLISDWPNPSGAVRNSDKVPSVISYRNGRVRNWGYEVELKDDSFRWVKILLEPNHKYAKTMADVRQSNELLTRLNKTAEEVVTDYLREIWTYTKADIRRRVDEEDWQTTYKVRIILTVPAMWSHAAKDKTLKAARAAGLPDSIRLVTEPEAAALATLADKAEDNSLSAGDAFVVCDAGGGTVDLISYQVTQTNPLRIKECAIGDGGLCGSVFLDMAFVKYIVTIVGEAQYARLKENNKKRMLRDFEYGIKRSFTGDPGKDYSVELKGVEDNEEEGIDDDTIPLRVNHLRGVFDHVCGQIETLVDAQVNEVTDRSLKVKAILLVGGFGESKYLHGRLEKAYESRGIRVLQVSGAWSAICRGACMWGLDQEWQAPSIDVASASKSIGPAVRKPERTIVSRISRYSYGICVAEPFDSSKHLWKDRVMDPSDGQFKATNQMRWLLRRGEVVEEGRCLDIQVVASVHGVGFGSSGHRAFEESLMFCELNDPPSRKEDSVKTLVEVNYRIPEGKIWLEKSYQSHLVKGKWRDCTFHMVVILGGATLAFAVIYRGEVVAAVEAKYMQDF